MHNTSWKVRFGLLLASLGLGLASSGAFAAVSGTSAVTSAVASSCRLVSLDSLSFGTYSPISGTAGVSNGVLSLACTKKTAVSASPISGGSTLHGTSGNLNYAIYADSGMSKVWGAPTVNTVSINYYTGNGANFIYFTSKSFQASFTACASVANGTLFNYYSNGGACYTNYSSTPTSYGISNVSQGTGLSIMTSSGGATLLASKSVSTYGMFYVPYGSPQTAAYTYTTPVSMGAAVALTGTSSSVNTPMNLTYYAKVPANQDVSAGVYTDTVTVQVNF